eukprot:TRINITY_DN900_c0_g1_i1.p1 TRINITY_DN900_c0_g1~~TRINITY_DN900_c0_g1_i1.p1  ORF type:complete len:203 (-),score=55.55 TRINITY_DN900_c0_g1_i1:181-708(-)
MSKLEERKKSLSQQQYDVTQFCSTEPPFTGKFWNKKEAGTYVCVVCTNPLFSSSTKFNSGTGWPSFFDKMSDSVSSHEDISYGMKRIEVKCKSCGAHLGHLFPDGPTEKTGLRYCINSASLEFIPDEKKSASVVKEDKEAEPVEKEKVKEKEKEKVTEKAAANKNEQHETESAKL